MNPKKILLSLALVGFAVGSSAFAVTLQNGTPSTAASAPCVLCPAPCPVCPDCCDEDACAPCCNPA